MFQVFDTKYYTMRSFSLFQRLTVQGHHNSFLILGDSVYSLILEFEKIHWRQCHLKTQSEILLIQSISSSSLASRELSLCICLLIPLRTVEYVLLSILDIMSRKLKNFEIFNCIKWKLKQSNYKYEGLWRLYVFLKHSYNTLDNATGKLYDDIIVIIYFNCTVNSIILPFFIYIFFSIVWNVWWIMIR